MFIGHYAVALALKGTEKKASLGLLCIGVQFVDILFLPLGLYGIETFNRIPNYTGSTHFELTYIPYSHSLASAFVWGALTYGLFRLLTKHHRVSLVMGLSVLSHWFLDLIVHTPDLPLMAGDGPKLGFGLWNQPLVTYILEGVMVSAGLWFYLKKCPTETTSTWRRASMVIFVGFLLLVNIRNIFGPAPTGKITTIILVIFLAYMILPTLAWIADRVRFSNS